MLLYRGEFCAMIYRNADLKNWLPVLREQPLGFAGMFYFSIDDLDAFYGHASQHAEVVKEMTTDESGQRMFYIRDLDGYVIGFNDKAALQASDLGKYASRPAGTAPGLSRDNPWRTQGRATNPLPRSERRPRQGMRKVPNIPPPGYTATRPLLMV
ncbi:VOC family protein [Streptomyces sp. WAC05374]|uniref:VOC family protein n=1 Tax=Streptomyces sp. WAC05374 TaxID=2487420 RepID=UPI00163C264B|nr:VOC family protein [Streptomyces sp. WAC05374]